MSKDMSKDVSKDVSKDTKIAPTKAQMQAAIAQTLALPFAYKATGNAAYKDEMTKVDKFSNPYMGKFYGDPSTGATEILSMGMEMMYANPVALAQKDPEMFDFIYSVVRRG